MYKHGTVLGSPYSRQKLEAKVGQARLARDYVDTVLGFREVVELGKSIEAGQKPEVPQHLMREFNELRLAALALRKGVRQGSYPKLAEAVPHIERYIAMAMQYAQERGLLPKPNPDAFMAREIRGWLRSGTQDPGPARMLEWLSH